MNTLPRRRATAAEIIAARATDIRFWIKVSFRHFVLEASNPRAANGVSHRQTNRSTIRVIDGVPCVMHHGRIEPITGTHFDLGDGRSVIADLRLDSPHLPAGV